MLLSFQGNLGSDRLPHYSRGIRQRLHHLASKHSWLQQHSIVIAGREGGDYATLLSSSIFCLVVPGAPGGGSQHARRCARPSSAYSAADVIWKEYVCIAQPDGADLIAIYRQGCSDVMALQTVPFRPSAASSGLDRVSHLLQGRA